MKNRKNFKMKYHNIGKNPYLEMGAVLFASVCDFVTIQSVMEFYLTESLLIQVIITAAVAFILNYLPSLLGKTMQDKNSPNRTMMICVLLTSFILLFMLTFLLRWNSREMMFQNSAALNLMSDTNANLENTIGAGENTLTIILGCSTLFTSVLSFIFSYTALTPEEKKRHLIELRLLELENEKDIYQAHIDELERVINEDANAKREEIAYQAAVKNVEDYKSMFKEEIRIALTESLQNANAVSTVLQKELPVMI